ncbi:MAG TPA: helix-hairpin-helix domain-containing protein [Firmicutes bacterium]|nr:helix-hairpin-helix domain-containing protein [Bacillota bacterium]
MKCKRYIFLLVLILLLGFTNVIPAQYSLTNQLDINNCTFSEIKALPVSESLAENIYEYREFKDYFNSIFDLLEVRGMTQDVFIELKPLIMVTQPIEYDSETQRLERIYYIIEQQDSDDGFQEGTSDEWVDLLISPQNINRMSELDILNFPNVSPVDAVAISKRLKLSGNITSVRSLRTVTDLSNYAYRNLRNFVTYTDPESQYEFHFSYYLSIDTFPYYTEEEESDVAVERYSDVALNSYPGIYNKLRLRWGNKIKIGLITNRNPGDRTDFSTYEKGFINYNDLQLGELFSIDKIVLGHYKVAFGHGLVMENSDYFSPRKTGYGFSKRILGLIGDSSRTDEFALRGFATEFTLWKFHGTWFYSQDKKDAILNPDGTVMSMVINRPYIPDDELEEVNRMFEEAGSQTMINNVNDQLDETIVGGHLQLDIVPGTNIGVTAYEAKYDKFFRPLTRDEFGDLIRDDYLDRYQEKLYREINNEIFSMYSSTDYGRYRRVYGIDFQTVINNFVVSGEYGTMNNESDAAVISTYIQYDALYLLAMYRNYDLDYDNPYMRAFSEKKRFDDTFLEGYAYMLKDPITYPNLYVFSPYNQPEEGLYLETRYQISRQLTITRAYIDTWRRKSDSRHSIRFQGEMEYRPIFPLRFRLKHKYLVNKTDNELARSVSKTRETTVKVQASLSNFNRLEFEYFHSQTWLPPYPYLSNNAEPNIDNLPTGSQLLWGDAYTLNYTHNFVSGLSISGAVTYWDCPGGGSVWDWEDTRIDFMDASGVKYWFVISDRISENLSIRLKFWYKRILDQEKEVRTWWNADSNDPDFPDINAGKYPYLSSVRNVQTAFKLSLFWRF